MKKVVGGAGADHLLAVLAADPPDRGQLEIAFLELRQRRWRRQQYREAGMFQAGSVYFGALKIGTTRESVEG